jgi:molybdopterin/thiamine biosynthesis adenylyltransferase
MSALKADYLDEDKHERSKRIGWLDFDKLKKSKVLVVGAGAIGNEVLKDLVLSGFRTITIVDMDHVVRSNLNRCVFFSNEDADRGRMKAEVVAEKLKVLEPEANVTHHVAKIQDLGEDFIPSHDIVLGCLDNLEARLHLNAHCCHHGIPYLDGGMLGFVGKVQVVIPPDTPCLECNLNKTHVKIMQLRFSCTGKDVTFFEPKLAAEITTTSIVSAIQVRETIKVISGKHDEVIRNLFYYDGIRNVSDILEVQKNPNCPHHDYKTR